MKNRCDYILVPRLFCIKKNEQVCTNFNALYDLVNNLFDVKIINYNVNLNTFNYRLCEFIKMGKMLGCTYKDSYKAYKSALEYSNSKRIHKEVFQKINLNSKNLKVLVAGHSYNLHDELIGKIVSVFLKKNNITVIYSDRIENTLIDSECKKLSTDIHWTHNKEMVASVNYYKDKVDGIILISSFPCGPDSLIDELISRKIKNIPVITLVFEDLNSEAGVITRLESFIDIIKNLKEKSYEKSN